MEVIVTILEQIRSFRTSLTTTEPAMLIVMHSQCHKLTTLSMRSIVMNSLNACMKVLHLMALLNLAARRSLRC